MVQVFLIMAGLPLKVINIIYVKWYFYKNCIVVSPEVSIKPAEARVTEGKTVEFSCTATGFGANDFTYQWFLNDLPVAGQATPTLVINDVSEDDTGNYMCFVRNAYGGVGQSETARLTLMGTLTFHL